MSATLTAAARAALEALPEPTTGPKDGRGDMPYTFGRCIAVTEFGQCTGPWSCFKLCWGHWEENRGRQRGTVGMLYIPAFLTLGEGYETVDIAGLIP